MTVLKLLPNLKIFAKCKKRLNNRAEMTVTIVKGKCKRISLKNGGRIVVKNILESCLMNNG